MRYFRLISSIPLHKTLASVAMLIFTGGCFDHGMSTREADGRTVSNFVMAITGPANSAAPAPIQLPIRLAIAQVGEIAPSPAFVAPLRKQPGLISQLDPIPFQTSSEPFQYNNTGSSGHWKNFPENATASERARAQIAGMCQIAQRLGDTHLVLFGGTIDQASVQNELSLLNLTIIGAYLVPSQDNRAEGRGIAAVIDVRTQQVVHLLSATSRLHKSQAAAVDGKSRLEMLQTVQDSLAAGLADDLIQRLQQRGPANALAGGAAAAPPREIDDMEIPATTINAPARTEISDLPKKSDETDWWNRR